MGWLQAVDTAVGTVNREKQSNNRDYPDMADILPVVDLLITDYSSCANEIIRAGKGAILAAFDLEEYTKNNRDLLVDLSHSGFLLAKNQKELEDILNTYSENDYAKNARNLCKRYGMFETGCKCENKIVGKVENKDAGKHTKLYSTF